MKLYLASTSPRRKELLQSLKIPFEIIPPLFKEQVTQLSPAEEALYFAEQKARSVASLCPRSLIIGSDTLIKCDGEKMGKPKDTQEARQFLKKLSGRSHSVLTAVVLLNTEDGTLKKYLADVTVTFHDLSDQDIEDSLLSGEALDKAGAYAIQGKGKKFIQKIEGEKEAVIGLPLKVLKKWLLDLLKSLS